MIRVFIVVALAAVGGIAIGRLTGGRPPEDHVDRFGPFTEVDGFSPQQVPEYLKSLVPTDAGSVEILGDQDFDFGVMHRNTEGEHIFQLKNVGNGPLRLEVTGSTCKCTVGELDTNAIAPGEIADVKLSWKTKSPTSEFSQTATIETSDPANVEIKLSIHGTLIDSLVVEPSTWAVGDVASGEPIDLKLTAYQYDDGELEIEEAGFVESTVSDLTDVKWTKRQPSSEIDGIHVAAKEAIDFQVSIQPGLRQGSLNHLFRVRYGGESIESDTASFDVNLTGNIVGPLQLFGGGKLEVLREGGGYRFHFGTVKQGESTKERVHLIIRGEAHKDLKLKISDVKPNEVFEASMGEEKLRGRLRSIPVDISVKPDAPIGIVRGHKTLDTGYIVIEPQDSPLSPLKLWLTVEVTATDKK
ncbi:MAG: DUF1573 domain-containing protein [Pirellulaceae bacterium]